MKTKANVTQLRAQADALAEVAAKLAGTNPEGDRCAILGDAIRAMYAGATGATLAATNERAVTALEFLEDTASMHEPATQDACMALLRAISVMQESLGVPADRRAINNTPEGADHWRPQVAAKLEEVGPLLQAAQELSLDPSNAAFALQLIGDAVGVLERVRTELQSADAGTVRDLIQSVQAMTLGAQHMPETSVALPLIAGRAFALLGEAWDYCDN